MTTFYKNRSEVPLKPGQTLGYTAGKGYYAAGKPETAKPTNPAPANPSGNKPAPASGTPAAPAKPSPSPTVSVAPTRTRPVAAKTPATPPKPAKPAPVTGPTPTTNGADAASSLAPDVADRTTYYKRPGEVRLLPGQAIAFSAGKGYYAAGRPQPTKAPTAPRPSTVKVIATSNRASTESPVAKRVETRDGRTTITLSHATKPAGDKASQEHKVAAHATEKSAKPSKDATHRTAVGPKKASSRVHEQLAKTRDRPRAAESGIGHHPGRAKRDVLATAASAGGIHDLDRRVRHPGLLQFNPDALFAALTTSHFKVDTHGHFYFGDYRVDVSAEASLDKPEVTLRDGRLVLTWGDNTLASVSLDGVLYGFAKLLAEDSSTSQKLRDALSGTLQLPGGGTVSTSVSDGTSVTISSHGVTTTIGLKLPDSFFISTEVSEPLALHPPLKSVDVGIKATVELTPEEKKPVRDPAKKKSTFVRGTADKALTSPIHNPNLTGVGGLVTRPRTGVGGEDGSGSGDGGEGLGSGEGIYDHVMAIAASVEHPRSFGNHPLVD